MSMNFCYCIGGTGARISEVAAHLCAMNMVNGQKITFIVVDKDKECGGTEKAIRVIEQVTAMASPLGVGALERSTVVDPSARREFCASILEKYNWDFTDALEGLAKARGVNGNSSLKGTLSSGKSDEDLFNAFYSKSEQDTDTAKGFYGHPSIGALIFKNMIEAGGWNSYTSSAAEDIAFPVKDFLKNNPGAEAKVFIVGSVFGGTGASIFSNLAAHIANTVGFGNRDRLVIGGVLLLPYFGFKPDATGRIQANEFYQKSRVALDQYASDPMLIRTKNNPTGSFDSLYLCGQNPLHEVGEYSEGGTDQINHFDLVDLVAARAMTEFFSIDFESIIKGGKIYEYRLDNAKPAVITQANIREMSQQLTSMLIFSAFVINKVYGQFILNRNTPGNVFMLKCLFKNNEILKHGAHGNQAYSNYIENEIYGVVNHLAGYCFSYLQLAGDLACNGRAWGGTVSADSSQEYALFNPSYIQCLVDIYLYLTNNNLPYAERAMAQFQNMPSPIPGAVAGRSLTNIEDRLLEIFKGKDSDFARNSVPTAKRISDYVHEAFKICKGGIN